MASGVAPTAVTIANGQSLSPASAIVAGDVVGVQTDAQWDAAGMTFQGSYDGVAYFNLFSQTAEVALASMTGAAMVALDPTAFRACMFLKVRSGTAAAPVVQNGATVVTILSRQIG